MHWIDLTIFVVYMAAMLGVGFFFFRTNKGKDDYYVGGRNMGSWHVGLSVVATDVGGGFSIGLGGLGFTMGISGSWMLFTGLIGAWLAAVFLIPKVFKLGKEINLFTFPQVFEHLYNKKVALIAAMISAIGYLGFTASQLLAGAKLASSTFVDLSFNSALIIMGVVAIVYTVMGGLKAVIYTDTIQWIILLAGLIFIGLPMAYYSIGGWETISSSVQPELLSLTNVDGFTLLNWAVTIIPIWFIGMTLYQRIFACKDEKQARKAWYIAGIFEWPIMAFLGVLLGLFARIAADQGMFSTLGFATVGSLDAELGLPLLLRQILPVGLMGLMMSAYFSAILSTADSCLMACSGNVVSDLIGKFVRSNDRDELRLSQIITLAIGAVAVLIAMYADMVLDLMLHSYAFMVSGLFVPILFALYSRHPHSNAALGSMVIGGGTTLILNAFPMGTLHWTNQLDPIVYGLSLSLIAYVIIRKIPSISTFQKF
ncbi:MAG: sodium:solute symporter family protein [Cryomorphaceae bacterium]